MVWHQMALNHSMASIEAKMQSLNDYCFDEADVSVYYAWIYTKLCSLFRSARSAQGDVSIARVMD